MKSLNGRGWVLALVFIVLLVTTPVFAKEWSAEQKDVLASFNEYLSAVRQGNLKEIVSFWHPKYVSWDYAQALPTIYDVSIRAEEGFFKNYKFNKLEFDPLEIQVEGNLAIILANYNVIIQNSAGKEISSSGSETIILVKKDKKWAMMSLVWRAKDTLEEAEARVQQESAEVRKVIEAYNADLGRYYASGNIDSVMSVFAEDAHQMAPNGPALEGREKMRAFWKQAVSWGQWNFALTTVSVTANTPLAIELGRYKLEFTPSQAAPPGMKASVDTGNYVCYWRLEDDGKWRIVYDIATSDQPIK
jgi:ketosteroid isomerase-like protein